MNKKNIIIITLLILIPLVSAQSIYLDLEYGVKQLINHATDFLRPIFEVIIGEYSGSEFFLQKSLLLILLFVVIYAVIKKTPLGEKNNPVSLVIAISVSIIAVRYMSENQFIRGILLPYGALGITLTTILPFLLFFYFVHVTNMSGVGRRISWLLFGIVFVSLYITQRGEISELGNYIYLGIIGGVAVSFFFDRGIQRYFFAHELNLFYNKAKSKAVASLQSEYLNILNVDTPDAERRRKSIEDNLRRLGAGTP